MTTKAGRRAVEQARRQRVNEVRREQARRERRRRRAVALAWVASLVVIAAVVTAMVLSSRPQSSNAARVAPTFTLTDTDGRQVSLADFRGSNVLLYFSEGAGCQSCLVQMAEIEKSIDEFTGMDVTVLPIVMNTREQIMQDMMANGVQTPFLLDNGEVAEAYGTLGKGMHGGLPGHSFVLIDKDGIQRWYGEYPSMWLAPSDLITEIRKHVAT